MTVDDEVKAIGDRKRAAALVFKAGPGPADKQPATLTPVGTEKGARGIPDVPEVFLTNEAVRDIARDLRAQAATLIAVADALDAHTGAEAGSKFSVALTPQARRLVGEDPLPTFTPKPDAPGATEFAEKWQAMRKSAEAATYDPPRVKGADPIDLTAEAKRIFADDLWSDWVCPKHGDANVKNITSKGGRRYRACEHCTEYEKR